MDRNTGKVVQIIGPVLDIKFEKGYLPQLLNAVEIFYNGQKLVCEVEAQVGDDTVRCIAMSSTDGLPRGIEAVDTGAPIKVPVGKKTLGRIFNLLGDAIDDGETPTDCDRHSIHRAPPPYSEQMSTSEILETCFVGRSRKDPPDTRCKRRKHLGAACTGQFRTDLRFGPDDSKR